MTTVVLMTNNNYTNKTFDRSQNTLSGTGGQNASKTRDGSKSPVNIELR